jgi:hypothetical protein
MGRPGDWREGEETTSSFPVENPKDMTGPHIDELAVNIILQFNFILYLYIYILERMRLIDPFPGHGDEIGSAPSGDASAIILP